ncbi:MAG: polyphosphate kinase 2 [Planctomycetota bacterium]
MSDPTETTDPGDNTQSEILGASSSVSLLDEEAPPVKTEPPASAKLREGTALHASENGKESKSRTAVWVKKRVLKYETELERLQMELLKMQGHVRRHGMRMLCLFEGRDAAGKGGTIKRITEHLNPRGARVVALEKPSDRERTQWYFQRYISHLPCAGEIVLFDRSWYNRSMVEPVMGFCSDEENKRFLKDVPLLEQMLVKDGIQLFKYYFSVSKAEQLRRFNSRKTDLLKQFKVSEVDLEAQKRWHMYTVRKFQMLNDSNRTIAPWTIIRSDNKKAARLNCIKHLLQNVAYEGKTEDSLLETDPKVVVSGIDELRMMEEELMLSCKEEEKVMKRKKKQQQS